MTTTDGFGRLLVVSAHAADFVWRAAGYIAVVTSAFGQAHVVCLSYGEHGESPGAWKQPGMTLDRVKEIRRAEARRPGGCWGPACTSWTRGTIRCRTPRSWCCGWRT